MGNNKKGRTDGYSFVVENIELILGTFSTYIFNYIFPSMVMGIITCILLIVLWTRRWRVKGAVRGIVLSIMLMSIMIFYFHETSQPESVDESLVEGSTDMGRNDKNSSTESQSENTKDIKRGTLVLSIEELIMEYKDQDGTKKMTSNIPISEEICENIFLRCIDYDIALKKYEIKNGEIWFSDVPVGTYDIKIQLKNFSLCSGTIKLKENELDGNVWNKSICVQSDEQYKEFEIVISDSDGQLLDNYKCDLKIVDTEYEVKNIVSTSEGKLPYIFNMPNDLKIQLTLYYDEDETYINEYLINDVTNPLYAQFSILKNDCTITPQEVHQPNDSATKVNLVSWNKENDIGIDGKKHGNGIKVSIYDIFIEWGAGSSSDVISRVTIPFCEGNKSGILNGVFILDQTMYGSKSTGVISILVNNEEVFTTGEIGGNTTEALPFSIHLEDADAIVILVKAHLVESKFTYGFVSE